MKRQAKNGASGVGAWRAVECTSLPGHSLYLNPQIHIHLEPPILAGPQAERFTPARFAEVTGLLLGVPEDALDPYADRLTTAFRHGLGQKSMLADSARVRGAPVESCPDDAEAEAQ